MSSTGICLVGSPARIARRGLTGWRSMAPATRRLVAARFWRSLSQGALVVDLSLYLHAMGWSGAAIGGVLTGGGLFGATMSLLVGVVSDRRRRKPFVIAYEAITCVCAITALLTAHPALLVPAIVLAGFGRGANGAAGPFSPAEQAWLAEAVKPANRGWVYSVNTACGFAGMTIGSLMAALPALWVDSLGSALSYRPLFAIVLLGNAVNLLLIINTPETKRTIDSATHKATRHHPAAAATRAQENRFLRRLIALNTLNGLGIGLIGPLIAYWFKMRFDAGPAAIGALMAMTFLATAAAALLTAVISRRIGLVRSVLWGRGIGVIFLILMPLMPIYLLAAGLYLLRSVVNRGTVGARQALTISLVRDERRGLAVSLNLISMMLPMAIGPTLGGVMIGAHWFALPFYIAAVLQALYLIFYARLFAPLERELNAREAE